MSRVFFGNSGSDAADSAIKMVTLYNNLRGKPRKKTFISRWRGYHGVTMAAGSLTGLESVHRLFDLPLPFVGTLIPRMPIMSQGYTQPTMRMSSMN